MAHILSKHDRTNPGPQFQQMASSAYHNRDSCDDIYIPPVPQAGPFSAGNHNLDIHTGSHMHYMKAENLSIHSRFDAGVDGQDAYEESLRLLAAQAEPPKPRMSSYPVKHKNDSNRSLDQIIALQEKMATEAHEEHKGGQSRLMRLRAEQEPI